MKPANPLKDWTAADWAAAWIALYHASVGANVLNRALVTKRFCAIDERVKRPFLAAALRRQRKGVRK